MMSMNINSKYLTYTLMHLNIRSTKNMLVKLRLKQIDTNREFIAIIAYC